MSLKHSGRNSAVLDDGSSHALVLHNVGRRFGALDALSGVSLSVSPGERRVILGANGAGKTTLFNVISGNLPATSGVIRLNGQDITRLPAHKRVRLGMRRTYQITTLFGDLSVEENLILAVRGVRAGRLSLRVIGGKDHDRHTARHLAERIGIGDLLSRRVGDLGHGQQRQLEVGMTLVGEPRLLLLDEPAAGLARKEREVLAELIRSLGRGLTILLIEHDMDLAMQTADQVTVMHNGRVVSEGSPEEIQASQLVHDIYMGRLPEPKGRREVADAS